MPDRVFGRPCRRGGWRCRASLPAVCALGLIWGVALGGSGDGETGISDLSLEDLLKIKVTVTSLVERPVDEAPGIVSVITREEIESSGARTLEDLLVFVPGFSPGQDEQNVRGYGVRGLWTMEGKMLVLLDGVRINEPLYGNTVFARQYAVDLIERIEIIRGPASAVYGEYGELAVLNIVSVTPRTEGGGVLVTHGQGPESWNRRLVSAGYWGSIGGLDLSLTGSLGGGHLGNGRYTDKYGASFPLEEYNRQDFWTLNAGAGSGDFSIRFIGGSLGQESHLEMGFDPDGGVLPVPEKTVRTTFDSYHLDTKYSWMPAGGWRITPRIVLERANSWRKTAEWVFDAVADPYDARHYYRDFPHTRVDGGATATWELNPRMTLVLGGEWSREAIEANLPEAAAGDPWGYYYFYGDDTTRVTRQIHSFFGEYDLRSPIADVTLGGRVDKDERFEAAWLPRVAVTRRIGKLYVKGLASRAYHPPTLMTTSWLDPEIEPEFARNYEAEVGYKPSAEALFRLNGFAIEMNPVILYSGQFSNTEVHSRGLEAEGRYEARRARLTATYSLYRASYDDRENAMAEDEEGRLVQEVTLGFPTHKATLSASVRIGHGVSISPGLVWFSKRYSRSSDWFWDAEAEDSDYLPANRVLPATLLANVYARAVFLNGWEAGLGVFNLTDESYPSLTGSYVGNPPVPGPSREWVARVGYTF